MKVGRRRNYDNVDVWPAKERADVGVARDPVVGGESLRPAAASYGHQRRSWHMPRGDLGPRASHEPGADDTDAYNHATIRHATIRHATIRHATIRHAIIRHAIVRHAIVRCAGAVELRAIRRQRGS